MHFYIDFQMRTNRWQLPRGSVRQRIGGRGGNIVTAIARAIAAIDARRKVLL